MAVIIENKIPTIASIVDNKTGKLSTVDRFGNIVVAELTHLIGGEFISALDTSKWVTTLANAGTVAVAAGEATVATNTTANGSAILSTIKPSRFISSASNRYLGGVRLNNTGVTNNIRRWGIYDADNGLFFQLSGTTIGVVSRKATVDTIVTSFNGDTDFVLDTNQHTYEIHISGGKQLFLQDGNLIHTITAATTSSTATYHLKIRIESVNSGGITSDNQVILRGQAVSRFGKSNSRPDSYYTAGVNETRTLKIEAGTLQKVINVDSVGSVTIYDNTAGSGTVISTIDCTKIFGNIAFDLDFSTGLTYVTSGGAKLTFVWD